LMDDLDR
nr:10 kda calcium-binding protein peptide T-25 [rabbits, lung, Peptide Partial, 7 aa] [Oryctolagus cuniculus]